MPLIPSRHSGASPRSWPRLNGDPLLCGRSPAELGAVPPPSLSTLLDVLRLSLHNWAARVMAPRAMIDVDNR